MKKIFPILMFVMILVSAFVIAEVNERNEVFLGKIVDNAVQYTDKGISNVDVLGVVCGDADCATIDGYLWNGDILNTGGNNKITLVYPTQSQSQYGYGVYFFKKGYIPSELTVDWAGTGTIPNTGYYDNYLYRKDVCLANIDGVNVDPGVFTEGETVSINVTIDAPLVASGSLDYLPAELGDYYKTDVEVTLELVDNYDASNVVYTETRNVDIGFGEDVVLNFDWVTVVGDYRVVITTDVPDAQCISSIADTSINNFHVNPAGNHAPTLNIPDQTIGEGDTLVLDLDDFSNDVDGDALSYALVSGEGSVAGDAYMYDAPQDANVDNESYTIVINVSDGSGGLDTDSFVINVIDDDVVVNPNNAPVIDNFNVVPAIGNAPLDVSFSGNVSDADGDALTCVLDFGDGSPSQIIVGCVNFNVGYTYANVGNYVATLNVSDGENETSLTSGVSVLSGSGNVSSMVWFVNPTTLAGYHSQDYIFANVSANDTGLTRIVVGLYNASGYLIDDAIANSGSIEEENFTGLVEGDYYLNASAEYSNGDINYTETRHIVLDVTAPQITLISPTDGESVEDNDVAFTYALSDASGIMNAFLYIYDEDGDIYGTYQVSNESGINSYVVYNLPYGDYTFTLECFDLAGNVASVNRSMTVKDTSGDDESNGCSTDWVCSGWGDCSNGYQYKSCIDAEDCGTLSGKPDTVRTCLGSSVFGTGFISLNNLNAKSNSAISIWWILAGISGLVIFLILVGLLLMLILNKI